jgi:hypothetical protein
MLAGKNKNRPASGFFTKIAHVQVVNFIPVKVSTLYMGGQKVQLCLFSICIKKDFFYFGIISESL